MLHTLFKGEISAKSIEQKEFQEIKVKWISSGPTIKFFDV